MATFYHGTVSIFQERILKEGLSRTSGNPNFDHEVGKYHVWLSPDIEVAADYAEMKAKCFRAPVGSKVKLIRPSKYHFRGRYLSGGLELVQSEKLNGSVVPFARAIVFAIDLPESWKVTPSPTSPGEWRVARRIPPSMLTLVDLGALEDRHGAIHAAIKALAPCLGIDWRCL